MTKAQQAALKRVEQIVATRKKSIAATDYHHLGKEVDAVERDRSEIKGLAGEFNLEEGLGKN